MPKKPEVANTAPYDDLCAQIRTATAAQGVALIVMDGSAGTAFAVQATMFEQERMPNC